MGNGCLQPFDFGGGQAQRPVRQLGAGQRVDRNAYAERIAKELFRPMAPARRSPLH